MAGLKSPQDAEWLTELVKKSYKTHKLLGISVSLMTYLLTYTWKKRRKTYLVN